MMQKSILNLKGCRGAGLPVGGFIRSHAPQSIVLLQRRTQHGVVHGAYWSSRHAPPHGGQRLFIPQYPLVFHDSTTLAKVK